MTAEGLPEVTWDTWHERHREALEQWEELELGPGSAGLEAEPAFETEPDGPSDEKRDATRIQKILFADLHGRLGTYRGMVVNLSRTGVLLTIVDPTFQPTQEQSELGLVGLRIASHFGESLRVEFLSPQLTLDAEVIRIFEGKQGDDLAVYMGCRYLKPLDEEQCLKLKLPVREAPAKEPPEEIADKPLEEPTKEPDPGVGGKVYVVAADALARPRAPSQQPVPAERRIRLAENGAPLGMQELLEMTVARRATDLHLKGGSPVRLRIDGKLVPVGDHKLKSNEAEGFVRSILTQEQYERFLENGDLDLAYSLEGRARFRINALMSRGMMGLAIRRIPEEVPTVEELGLAPTCTVLAERPRGLVLVTGPTGSGKSTTLAAMISHVNETRPCHILTMEDPIEYIHTERRAQVTQREIGRDTHDFASALRRALRQDPDVMLVGEMRDVETIGLAVTAAETGHLVFATLHTTSATLTVDRIVDVFPPAQQRQVRMQLADSLQGIICQMLLPRRAGGVIVAQEILVATGGVRALIREGKAPQVANMMQTGAKEGMLTIEDSLNDLIARGEITYDIALHKANHPGAIKRAGVPLAGGR